MKKIIAIFFVALLTVIFSLQASAKSSLLDLKTVEITDDTEITVEERHVEIIESAKQEMDMHVATPKDDHVVDQSYTDNSTVVTGGLKNWFKGNR